MISHEANSTRARNTLQLDLSAKRPEQFSVRSRGSTEAMAATLPPPRLLPSGDSAIAVEFSRNIDDAANRRGLALDRALAAEPITGVTEAVPTHRWLLVHYDPLQGGFGDLGKKILALPQRPVPATTGAPRR